MLAVGFNDPYKPPFSYDEWITEKNSLDQLGKNGDRQFNLMTIFVEKELNSLDTDDITGFEIYTRPLNPYMVE